MLIQAKRNEKDVDIVELWSKTHVKSDSFDLFMAVVHIDHFPSDIGDRLGDDEELILKIEATKAV